MDYLNELKPSSEMSELYFEIIEDTFNKEFKQTMLDRKKFDKEIDTIKVKIDGIEEKNTLMMTLMLYYITNGRKNMNKS